MRVRLKQTEWQLQQSLHVPPLVQHRPLKVVTPAEYRKALQEASQWPLLTRLATDLWRRGVSRALFYEQLHVESNRLSCLLADVLEDLWAERGFNPDLVPPVLPPQLVDRVGPPSPKTVAATAAKVRAYLAQAQWSEADVEALALVLNPPPPVLDGAEYVAAEPEVPVAPKAPDAWHVWDGNKWVKATSRKDAQVLLRTLQAQATTSLATLLPVPDLHQRRCSLCARALNELAIVERNPKNKVTTRVWHFNCWFLDHRLDHRLPDGMVLYHPLEAASYRYEAKTKTWTRLTPVQAPPPPAPPAPPAPAPVVQPARKAQRSKAKRPKAKRGKRR